MYTSWLLTEQFCGHNNFVGMAHTVRLLQAAAIWLGLIACKYMYIDIRLSSSVSTYLDIVQQRALMSTYNFGCSTLRYEKESAKLPFFGGDEYL